jgi:hypothetical protein
MPTGIAPGLCMIFHKQTWEMAGGFPENSITFDREFSAMVRRFGKIGLAIGLYVLHLYRYGSDNPKKDINHLI